MSALKQVVSRSSRLHRSPEEVLSDLKLSRSEKRLILSSWASDRHAVENFPWLRLIPGLPGAIALRDILAALRKLDDDGDNSPKPRGAAIRLGQLIGCPRFMG